MWNEYAPDPRMKLNLGIRRRLAPLLDNDLRKIALLNSMLFTFPGSPIIYYGDEIGMGDNIWLPDRNGVRTPMQWNDDVNAGFSQASVQNIYASLVDDEVFNAAKVNVAAQQADPTSLFNVIRHMIAVRKQYKAFGWGDFKWLDIGTQTVAAYARSYQGEKVLVLNNLSDEQQAISLLENEQGYIDLLTNQAVSHGTLTLQPYQYTWLIAKK